MIPPLYIILALFFTLLLAYYLYLDWYREPALDREIAAAWARHFETEEKNDMERQDRQKQLEGLRKEAERKEAEPEEGEFYWFNKPMLRVINSAESL